MELWPERFLRKKMHGIKRGVASSPGVHCVTVRRVCDFVKFLSSVESTQCIVLGSSVLSTAVK